MAAVREVAGSWALPVMAVSLIGSDVANAYTGMLAVVSIVSCFREVRHSVRARVLGSLLVGGIFFVLSTSFVRSLDGRWLAVTASASCARRDCSAA